MRIPRKPGAKECHSKGAEAGSIHRSFVRLEIRFFSFHIFGLGTWSQLLDGESKAGVREGAEGYLETSHGRHVVDA